MYSDQFKEAEKSLVKAIVVYAKKYCPKRPTTPHDRGIGDHTLAG